MEVHLYNKKTNKQKSIQLFLISVQTAELGQKHASR